MSLEERIKAAVRPIVPICVADHYTGAAEEYCTFNYSEIPVGFGDNRPRAMRCLVQLHWYAPFRSNPIATKYALVRAILAADFTAPTVTSADEEAGRHIVFEFEDIGEVPHGVFRVRAR